MTIVKRIGIDLHAVDGIFQGSRSHVLGIFSRVVRICPEMEFYIFLENVDILKETFPVFSSPNVHLVQMRSANPVMRLSIQFPKYQKKYALDLLHTQYISPIPSFCKTVITLHDILFESHPEFFTPLFNLRSKLLMRVSVMRAAHIFTVSEYSRQDISLRYGVNSRDITVIHNAADRMEFYPGSDGERVVVNNGLNSGGYILTVGRLEPRKNHLMLIKAYSQLDTNLPLVIIGQRDFRYQHIGKIISELGLSGRVLLLDGVADEDLPAYYRHAKLFVYPTWAEGFGMPVIEAMASGVPVITSNTTALPEVVGNAGLLIDPADEQGMRRAMETLINDNRLTTDYRQKGIAQANSYSWDSSAEKVANIYKQILHSTNNND